MKVLFLTLARINDINDRGIYPDLLKKFRDEGHDVTIVAPIERKYGKATSFTKNNGVTILNAWTTNIQKTNILEKGLTTLLIEYFFLFAIKKYLNYNKIDLILYSTPPITFTNLIIWLKKKNNAKTYLLLKDIFPQNAVDLKMLNKNNLLYSYFRKKEKKLYQLSDHIGCMSEYNKKYILEHNSWINEKKIEVNPNSIYLDDNENNSNKITEIINFIPKNKVIFVYGGNLGKPQGLNFLLEIIEDSIQNSDAYFIIVGSGTESKGIFDWFSINKPSNALLINHLSHQKYNELLQYCHVGLVFLHPDFTIPNYPSRILTYMENKLPILFGIDDNTDVGKEAEEQNYGFSCLNGDLLKFRNYIQLLTSDAKLREQMGENGFARLKRDFNVNYSYKMIMSHF
jgi:glycosyltransferase involved in cell wall biosynthesis